MPTYDYRCTKCGYTFAVEQSMTDKPLKRCRKCSGKLEKMLPRNINLIFRGSGFYVTDYKKSGPEPKAPAKSETEGGKSDSKPLKTGSEGAKK